MMREISAWGITQAYRGTNTPPYSSDRAWSRIGAAKHATGVLEVNRRGQRDLGENACEHVRGGVPSDRDGPLLDEVANVALDVVVFRLRGGHVVLGEGNAALAVFIGDSRADDGASEGRKKLAHEHNFLRRGGEGHVLGFNGGESDIV
jgi:hypothetical protein